MQNRTRDKHFEELFPIYFEGLNAYLNGDNRKLRQVCTSFELTLDQRILLQARRLMRKQEFEEAERSLQSLGNFSHSLFEAEKHCLLGNLYAYRGNWELASQSNQIAFSIYRRIGNERGSFLASYNLSAVSNQLGQFEDENLWLNEALVFAETPSERLVVLRARACQRSRESQHEQACKLIASALAVSPECSELEQINTVVVAVDVYFRADQWEVAESLLKEARKSKLNRHKGRVHAEHFFLQLLQGKIQDLPQLPEGVEKESETGLQWQLLKNFITGDKDLVESSWKKLHSKLPEFYRVDFANLVESERLSLFGKCLENLQRSTLDSVVATMPIAENLGGKLALLVELLSSSSMPLRKEYLIEKIWKTSYNPSYDKRFYRLIERLRQDFGYEITNSSRAYKLSHGAIKNRIG